MAVRIATLYGFVLSADKCCTHKSQFTLQGVHTSLRGTGVTKMPVVGLSSRGQDTSSGTCPGLSLKVNLHVTVGFSVCTQKAPWTNCLTVKRF